MQINETLLIRETVDSDRQVQIVFNEESVTTIEQVVAVYHKRTWQWMNTKHIGDSMQLARLHKRPFVFYDLDTTWFVRGMSIYQEFDEQQNELVTYLYKFPKDQDALDVLNQLLSRYAIQQQVLIQGRFVQLVGDTQDTKNQQTYLTQLTHGGYQAVLSFLFGLTVAYGSFSLEDNLLHTCDIYIPLLGSVVEYEPLFQRLSQMLTYHGMYHTLTTMHQQHGQVVHWSITDWEVLAQFASWLSMDEKYTASKQQTNITMKESLLDWLRPQVEGRELIDQVEYCVLKMLKK